MMRPNTQETSPKLAAYHEAGHAVAAYYLPLSGRMTRVTIRAQDLDEGDAGAQFYTRPGDMADTLVTDPAALRAHAVVTLAGTEVDRRLTDDEWTSGSQDYAEVRQLLVDFLVAREVAHAVEAATGHEGRIDRLEEVVEDATDAVEAELERSFASLRDEARRLVERYWRHIEAVAEALLERGALGGDEVRAVIESVDRASAARRAIPRPRVQPVA